MTQDFARRRTRTLEELYSHLHALVERRLWLKVVIGMLLGVALGSALSAEADLVSARVASSLIDWIALPGHLFVRLVQMIMIPLVTSSIIRGLAGGGNAAELRVVGPRVAIFFLVLTSVAIVIGVTVGLVLRPGEYIERASWAAEAVTVGDPAGQGAFTVTGFITNLLPENPLASMVSGEMLSIVVFAIIAGLAMLSLDAATAEPVLRLMAAVQEICMAITRWAMRIAPLAVLGLMCQVTATVGLSALGGLGMYVLAVCVSMALLAALNLAIVAVWGGIQPLRFLARSRELLLLAFSTASSAAVMPMSLKTAEEQFDVRTSLSRFIVPVGATINMNGTAAFQAVAAIFLAQVYGVELSVFSIVVLIVTTVAASIGTPSAPGAGVIVLASVLGSIGIPIGGIAIIIGVDRLLGMVRASLNVMGDLTACVFFEALERRRGPPA
jgi:Na+/H+-dicarboxylate symporter